MNPAVVRNSAAAALFSLFAVAACQEEVILPREDIDPPTLSPSTQWAGGTVRLEWLVIEEGGSVPALHIDDMQLASTASGAGWAEYRLPTTVSGPVQIELAGEESATFQVGVVGFRAASALDVSLEGNLLVWPRDGQASLLGGPGDHSGVLQVLPGLGQATYLIEDSVPISRTEVRALGPTYDPDLLLVPTEGYRAARWQLQPTVEVLDTLPIEFSRHAMLLSDSILVTAFHHEIWSIDLKAMDIVHRGQYEESRGVTVSAGGRFGAVRVGGSEFGPPVFSGITGNVIFHVDTLFRSYGVDFSPVGDTLYIAGVGLAEPNPEMLLAIDAFGGTVLGGIDLGAREPINIVRDRNGPWLYVAAAVLSEPNSETSFEQYAGEPPVMLVIDTRTMEIVGEMATTGFEHCLGWCEGSVAVDDDGVYFVMTGAPARVLAFDVLPD